jgi:hypothetical protein
MFSALAELLTASKTLEFAMVVVFPSLSKAATEIETWAEFPALIPPILRPLDAADGAVARYIDSAEADPVSFTL